MCEEKQLKELMKIFEQLTPRNQSQLLMIAKRALHTEKTQKTNHTDSKYTKE